jgi:threonine/homoserine/homoserine lactone efflux protein
MGWIDGEVVLVALAAMVSPTTLSFSVLALVLGDKPLRTGGWFWLGAFTATLVIGIVAAFVLGDAAGAPKPSSPKTWVAILDVVFAALIVFYVVRLLRRPPDPKRAAGMIERMSKLASSPAIAVVGAGAALANPGGFIPIALKSISETKPNAGQYIVEWLVFTLVALLPLAIALVMLVFARERTMRILTAARSWLERRARIVAAVILLLLAAALLRNGISGLSS